jgi:methyl-accepting chemotaxis protein
MSTTADNGRGHLWHNPVIRWLGNRSLRTKTASGILLMATVAVIVGGLAVIRMGSIHDATGQLYHNGLIPLSQIQDVEGNFETTRLDILAHILAPDPPEKETFEQKLVSDDHAVRAAIERYAETSSAPELVSQLKNTWASYLVARDPVLAASKAGDTANAERIRSQQLAPIASQAELIVEQLIEHETAGAKNRLDHATAEYEQARTYVIVLLTAGVLGALGLGMIMARTMVTTIRKVSSVIDGLAAGDLTRSADVATTDEVGRMATALDQAIANIRATISRLGENGERLAVASEELSTVNEHIATSAEQASARAEAVAAAAEQVSRNVDTVAAGSEEMTSSIQEIASSAAAAARVAAAAVEVATTANSTLSELGRSSGEIGDVVNLITSIAEQTNLLALNATIEAARAGDSGKGFAVVASEVKDLAQETAKATEDISKRVTDIQDESTAAVAAIEKISEVIETINGYAATIATAVEEQTVTTGEIGRNVTQAATGSSDIARNITDVAGAAQATSVGVGQSRSAARELSKMSADLRALVSQFQV